MSTPTRYYVSTALPTTLSTGLGTTGNPSIASMPGTWPTKFPYTLLIDWGQTNAEAIQVTSAPTGTGPYTVPCTRGVDGTTAQSHSSGAQVVHGTSARDFAEPQAYIADTTVVPFPSGDTTGATDTAAIQAAINACPVGKRLKLQAGAPYITNAPLVCNKRIIIEGPDCGYGWGIYAGSYSPSGGQFEPTAQSGAVIQAATGWAQGAAVASALLLLTADSSHWITEGPVIRNVCFSGTTGTGSGGVNMTATADAILGYGPVVDVIMDNVMCMYVRGWGINSTNDPSTNAGASINTPGTWRVTRSVMYACVAGGVRSIFLSDSVWDDVLCIGNTGPGWVFTGGGNSIVTKCRAEWNGGHGFWLTGAWETGTGFFSSMLFNSCSTDANTGDGVRVDATAGNYIISFNGLNLHHDGNVSGGGTGSGFSIIQTAGAGLAFKVLIRNMMIITSKASFATSNPANGLTLNGTGVWIDIDSSFLIGVTAAVSITGTPARARFGIGVSYWTGASDSPTGTAAQGSNTPGDLTVGGTSYLSTANVFGPMNLQTNPITGITYLGVKEGTNTRQGTATLNGTTAVTVSTTAVTANSRIHLTTQLGAGTVGAPYVSARTAGTSFQIKSTVSGDTSTVAWTIFEPG